EVVTHCPIKVGTKGKLAIRCICRQPEKCRRVRAVGIKLVNCRVVGTADASIVTEVHTGARFRINSFVFGEVTYVQGLTIDHTLAQYTGETLSAQSTGLVISYQSAHAVAQESGVTRKIHGPIFVLY